MAFTNKVATVKQIWTLSWRVSNVLADEKKLKEKSKERKEFNNLYARWIYGIIKHDLKKFEEGKIKKFLSGSEADDLINGRKKLADKYLKTLNAFISQRESEEGHKDMRDFLEIG
tara:strand:- start:122 stop:466 length:345 start_codon:yes stop_codon:yes gene_type:complete